MTIIFIVYACVAFQFGLSSRGYSNDTGGQEISQQSLRSYWPTQHRARVNASVVNMTFHLDKRRFWTVGCGVSPSDPVYKMALALAYKMVTFTSTNTNIECARLQHDGILGLFCLFETPCQCVVSFKTLKPCAPCWCVETWTRRANKLLLSCRPWTEKQTRLPCHSNGLFWWNSLYWTRNAKDRVSTIRRNFPSRAIEISSVFFPESMATPSCDARFLLVFVIQSHSSC